MSKKAEEQYARLLEDGMISDRLLEHPQFYRSFIRKFDEISVDGKYALDCRITEHKLSLERRGYYPSDTNGIYYGDNENYFINNNGVWVRSNSPYLYGDFYDINNLNKQD